MALLHIRIAKLELSENFLATSATESGTIRGICILYEYIRVRVVHGAFKTKQNHVALTRLPAHWREVHMFFSVCSRYDMRGEFN